MNTQTHKPRGKRANGFFVPAFENIVNEMMNTSLKDLQTDGKTQFTKPQANIQQTEDGYAHCCDESFYPSLQSVRS